MQVDAIELGTGDLAIPAMLIVSALKISFWHGIFAMLGATIGMSLLFFFIEKKKGYWPALPPIVFFALLMLLIYNFSPIRLP
jgi:presenilin-like A22 family membrane protease